MRKIVGLVVILLVLAGYSGTKKGTTCKTENQGIQMSYTLNEGEKDKVGIITFETVVGYDYSDMTKEDAEKTIADSQGTYDDIDGLIITYKANDDAMITTITVDLDKANDEELAELNIYYSELRELSYDDAIKSIKEDSRFACE